MACATAFAALPSRALGQDYGSAAGYNAGAVWFSEFNAGATATGGIAPDDLGLDLGWIIGIQAEHWFNGSLAARLNGALTQRPLSLPGPNRDIGVWMLDADLLLRLLPAEPYRAFNMFISAGAGVVRYKLGDGDPINLPAADASYDGDDSPRFAAAGGIGFDFLTSWTWDDSPIGVRFEAIDNVVFDSPFEPITGSSFSPVHNVRFVIGLFTGFGLLH